MAPDCEPRTRGGEWGAEERPRATKSDRSGGLSRSLGRNGQTLVWGVSGTGFYRAPSCGGPTGPLPLSEPQSPWRRGKRARRGWELAGL